MKTIKRTMAFLLILTAGVYSSCKKDEVMYNKGIESFVLVAKDAQGAETEYPGTIVNDEIVVDLPIEVDVTTLTSKYTVDNARTIVQVGSEVVEQQVTELDLTNPLSLTVKAEDRSKRTYKVRVEKKIALQSFGFYKADNPGLESDYIGLIKGLDVIVRVPESVNQTALVARFETTTGASLKIGDAAQQSKITVNDFSSAPIYTMTAAGLTTPAQYTVKLAILGRQWVVMGDNLTKTAASSLKLAVNPLTNQPYFIYQRTGRDESDNAIPTDNRLVSVLGYNGTVWQHLGASTGISAFRADATGIAFTSLGIPYISYKDYFNSEQKATVKKYENGDWATVGTERFSPVRSDYLSITMSANDVPFVAMAKSGTDATGVPARGLYVMNYQDSQWNNITPSGGITIFYDQLITGLDGNVYLGIMDRSTGVNKPSMFMYKNNAWTAVGPTSFTAPNGIVGFQAVSIAVDAEGEAYLAFQVAPSSGRMNHVMKYNKTTNTWQELGNAVPSGGESNKLAIAVDRDGQLFFAWANASSLMFKTFNKATNNWNTERRVISEKVNEFDMQIAPDGTIYIVASVPVTGKNARTVMYKYAK